MLTSLVPEMSIVPKLVPLHNGIFVMCGKQWIYELQFGCNFLYSLFFMPALTEFVHNVYVVLCTLLFLCGAYSYIRHALWVTESPNHYL